MLASFAIINLTGQEPKKYFDEFSDQPAFQVSLMRFISATDIALYRSILKGDIVNTKFSFKYRTGNNLEIDFDVVPNSLPPSNIHVVIGRNSVGKTMLISEIAKSYLNYRTRGFKAFPFQGGLELFESTQIKNLVIVAFSVFDRFKPLNSYYYSYVGLKKNR